MIRLGTNLPEHLIGTDQGALAEFLRPLEAHRDPGPGYPNWLDTCGHDQGGMLGRYVGSIRPPREMPARVVKARGAETRAGLKSKASA